MKMLKSNLNFSLGLGNQDRVENLKRYLSVKEFNILNKPLLRFTSNSTFY